MHIHRIEGNVNVFLVLYVNNLLILSKNVNAINSVKALLNNKFDIKTLEKYNIDMGDKRYSTSPRSNIDYDTFFIF